MKQDNKNSLQDGYRISELVEASGVSRDMIKYYLRAALLPTPDKPRPNLSLYSDKHLELIRLIQRFQDQTKLSLDEIARVFRLANYDANAIEIELLSDKYRAGGDDNIIPLQADTRKHRGLTFPQRFLEELSDAGLLSRDDTSDGNDTQLAALLWAARNAGVPLAFFQTAREKLAELAELEVKTLVAIKRPDLNYGAMVDNVTEVDRVINRWMIAEKSNRIRGDFQRVIDNSERAVSTLLDTIYRPSAVFRKRHRMESVLAQLDKDFVLNSGRLSQAHELCQALLLLGEYERAIALAETTLAVEPGEPISRACIALAHGMQNNIDQAFEFGSQLRDCGTYHPVILQARILALLLQAGRLGGVTDTSELMKDAGELFLEMPREPGQNQPRDILSLARANVAFPDFVNSRPQAIRALEALLRKLENGTVEVPQIPVKGLQAITEAALHINTLYYLGLLYDVDCRQEDAGNCFKQVIQLDPASNFGERAYLKLGQLS